MADPNYPITAFRFKVDFGGAGTGKAAFSEISGLDASTDVAEYRSGEEATLTVRKIPGLMKYNNVSMKRGILAGDNDFFDWWTKNTEGAHEVRDVTITLLNEAGDDTVTWSMVRAWPTKVEAPSFNATGNDVAVESIEFCHEGVTIKH